MSTTATPASHVGSYGITAIGAASLDYAISYVGGRAWSVTPAALDHHRGQQSQGYGAAVPTLAASYSGFVNGDTPAQSHHTANVEHNGNPGQSRRQLIASRRTGTASLDYAISYVGGTLVSDAGPHTTQGEQRNKSHWHSQSRRSPPRFLASSTAIPLPSSIGAPGLSTTATASSGVAGSPYPITVSQGTL